MYRDGLIQLECTVKEARLYVLISRTLLELKQTRVQHVFRHCPRLAHTFRL